jgi:putative MATE family efflux protein
MALTSQSRLIDSPGILRPMLRLAAPVLLEQILHLGVQYVDFYLTGNFLDEQAYLAAMTLMLYASWFIVNLFSLVGVGATALVARYVGAGDALMPPRITSQAILIGLVWSLALVAGGLPLVGRIVAWMGLEGLAAEAAAQFLRLELAVLPAIMVERVGVACLRGAGDTMSGLVVMTIVNVINAAVSYALLVGALGLPELGWRGLLIGTATGHVCGAVLILLLLIRGRAGCRLTLARMRPDREIIRRILRIGVPGGADSLGVVTCHILFIRVINQLGELASAAHGVAIQVEALAYMPGSAFQIAAATLAGQYLGAGQPQRATRSVVMAAAVACLVMALAGGAFYFGAQELVEFFLDPGKHSPEVVALASRLLRIIAYAMPALAVTMVVTGALRGAGDTRFPLLFTFLGFLVLRIPLATYLAHESLVLPGTGVAFDGFALGVVGAWYAMAIDVVFRGLLFVARFVHGGWKRVAV